MFFSPSWIFSGRDEFVYVSVIYRSLSLKFACIFCIRYLFAFLSLRFFCLGSLSFFFLLLFPFFLSISVYGYISTSIYVSLQKIFFSLIKFLDIFFSKHLYITMIFILSFDFNYYFIFICMVEKIIPNTSLKKS